MNDPALFRRRLTVRILGILGAATVAACANSSGTGGTTTSTSSSGPTGSSAGTGGTTSHAGTGGKVAAAGSGGGTGGMSGTGPFFDAGVVGSGGTGGSSSPTAMECFDWPPDGGFPKGPDAGILPFDAGPDSDQCPTDVPLVLYAIQGNTCPNGGWDAYAIASGPNRNTTNQCCYVVDLRLCIGGGRPYLLDDHACLSTLERGGEGWTRADPHGPSAPCLDDLGAEARAALAGAWAEDALREHASVASFSRFSLELLAAGAPADLVALAHQAALDEIRHAELCFALASAYAGEALGPGPFPVGSEIRVAGSLAELAASTVKEGCVGETVAAVTAAEQLGRATDPAVRAALARIADDEARHAELAWRTVAWAIRAGGDEVRAAAAQAFMEAFTMAETPRPPPEAFAGLAGGGAEAGGALTGALEAHGRLDAATAARVAASALAEVVGPSAAALLAAPAAPGRRVGVGLAPA